jgi:hypothetical protein
MISEVLNYAGNIIPNNLSLLLIFKISNDGF